MGGHRELIADRRTGWLFEAGNSHALAGTVVRLADARDSWPQLRDAGRRFIEEERTWQASVARYQDIYETLAGSGR